MLGTSFAKKIGAAWSTRSAGFLFDTTEFDSKQCAAPTKRRREKQKMLGTAGVQCFQTPAATLWR